MGRCAGARGRIGCDSPICDDVDAASSGMAEELTP